MTLNIEVLTLMLKNVVPKSGHRDKVSVAEILTLAIQVIFGFMS